VAGIKTLPPCPSLLRAGSRMQGGTEIKTLPLPLPIEGGEQNAGRAEIKI